MEECADSAAKGCFAPCAPLALKNLVHDPEAIWPFLARHSDPQIRFPALEVDGCVSVDTVITAEDGLPSSPVIYWTARGKGYTDDNALPLVRHGNMWTAVTPLLPKGTRWRLDPLDRAGRFRIDRLDARIVPGRIPGPLERLRDSVASLLSSRFRRTASDLEPRHHLIVLSQRERRYLATGNDPQLHLRHIVPAGFYMLELELELPATRSVAAIYLTHGHTEEYSLRLRSGRLAKRLLRVTEPSELRLDPIAVPGEFTLRHFTLLRVSERFARNRMQRKLLTARGRQQHTDDTLFRDYCALFEATNEGGISYSDWIREAEQPSLPSPAHHTFSYRPTFSIITPVYNTPSPSHRPSNETHLHQNNPNNEWCIADDASTDPQIPALLSELAAQDTRVKLVLRQHNGHIAEASNSALALATGDFLVLLDHDDRLAPHALHAVANALQTRPTAQILYSDEDKLDEHGERCDPYFKPDYSPDLLRSQNYICHLGVYRHELVQSVGGFRKGFEGSQDYDLLLRCVHTTQDPADILHLPQILYHWRKTGDSTAQHHQSKPYATESALRALQETAQGASVTAIAPGLYRHEWPLPDPPPLVSLIIPTRDHLDLLRNCVASIVERTDYPNLEILIVDNQSTCPDTLAYLARQSAPVRVLRYDAPFNYAALNNFAVSACQGSVIGLINNDIEVINAGWLREMVSQCLRPGIGCVGAKLYYPDDTIQHAGVVLGIGGVAGHSHKYFPRDAEGYFSRLRVVHDVSAVTGAALIVRKEVYEQVGGLDAQSLAIAFNDVDLCLRVRAAGYRNLFTPFAELYHHESKTRGLDDTPEKQQRFLAETETMRRRWLPLLMRDPYYSPHLTLLREDYSLAVPAPDPMRT